MSQGPLMPRKSPHVMELEPGKYAWCACGRSGQDPFCDGSHKGTDCTPIVFEIEETRTVALCGCKHNGSREPFCNGSHSEL